MMEFNENKPIYMQIVDYAYNCIIAGEWKPGLKIPSVRELSALLGVNSRTVLKAMDELQDARVIMPHRGMGFMLAEDAQCKVLEARRKEFFEVSLPALASEVTRLGISPGEVFEKMNFLIEEGATS